jgi:glycosyltransferase involved in cell wall biosynthesis
MSELILTIITVTKNCAPTINKTLDSVRAVKRPGIEYLVIDGASVDGTLKAIHDQGELVDRLVSEPDAGIYNAMNKGVKLAKGRYVLFINGDDVIVSDGFSIVMDSLTLEQDGIICATTLVGGLDSPAEALVAKPWQLPFFNSVPHPSSFVRRELLLLNPFREDLRIVSDYDFFLGAYLAGESFRVLQVVTALHQRGGASGDVERSQAELKSVRRERLGWCYLLINCISGIYRQYKRAFSVKPV